MIGQEKCDLLTQVAS